MRLATVRLPGESQSVAAEVHGDSVVTFEPSTTVLDCLQSADRSPATGTAVPLAEVALLAPIPRPRAIFGIGFNYASHVVEQDVDTPEAPIVFMKTPASAAPPQGSIPCPEVVRRLDYEGELGVVIGAGGAVAGYAVCNDLSARDLQRREPQWTRAKGFDMSCPYGPWITTADVVGHEPDLRLRTWVNGELRQDARTSELFCSVPKLVSFISETCTLEPGDLILTGTPEGVGMSLEPRRFLAAGDVVRVEIEELGVIENTIA